MTPHYADDWLTVYHGDARAVMAELPAESVHCVVTSPPYWGLRDYGTASWIGGDEACDHRERTKRNDGLGSYMVPRGAGGAMVPNGGTKQYEAVETAYRHTCGKCGAIRQDSQLGLEPTPEQYVENMVAVFREVRRVLRSDGTVWLNLGDSYAAGKTDRDDQDANRRNPNGPADTRELRKLKDNPPGRPRPVPPGLKPKDLVGIPWRVAFALQADGWYLRSDIIWSKPNPMPESVTDRPTKSHEYLFLLAKGQWKSAVVELADGGGKRRHLGENGWFEGPHVWANEVAIGLAAAILDSAEFQKELGLPALHPEVGHEGAYSFYRDLVGGLPVEHRATIGAARLFCADSTPEEFLRELYGLGIALADSHNLLIGGVAAKVALPPGIHGYGQASVTVDHPGEVREFEFVHGLIITSTPSTCTYYYDADAVREPAEYGRREWSDTEAVMAAATFAGDKRTNHGVRARASVTGGDPSAGRNLRSVWSIATAPYPGAHFATFPPKLVEPCIKAGTSEKGVCPECGAPWVREVERTGRVLASDGRDQYGAYDARRPRGEPTGPQHQSGEGGTASMPRIERIAVGWRPSCAHGHWYPCDCGKCPPYTEPATVLDPFAGSGTTGMVAQSLSRRAILIDLSLDYLDQLMKRNRDIPLGLAESA